MRSSISWAVLGLVIERPTYGYALGRRFEQVYGGVLPISNRSHIYAALDRLKSRSLIEEIPAFAPEAPERGAVRASKPRGPSFRATTQGMQAYRECLIAQGREDGKDSPLFARQLAMFCDDPDAALDVLQAYERASLEAIQTPISSSDGPPLDGSSDLIDRLAYEESRLRAKAKLDLVEYARREFTALVQGRVPQR
jgi:hypothetical protein